MCLIQGLTCRAFVPIVYNKKILKYKTAARIGFHFKDAQIIIRGATKWRPYESGGFAKIMMRDGERS